MRIWWRNGALPSEPASLGEWSKRLAAGVPLASLDLSAALPQVVVADDAVAVVRHALVWVLGYASSYCDTGDGICALAEAMLPEREAVVPLVEVCGGGLEIQLSAAAAPDGSELEFLGLSLRITGNEQCLELPVRWLDLRGESIPRHVISMIAPFVVGGGRTLVLPARPLASKRETERCLDDVVALVVIHLVQTRVVDPVGGGSVDKFLRRYLGGYRRKFSSTRAEVEVGDLLAHTLQHFSYSQQPFGLRVYVKRTIQGLLRRLHSREVAGFEADDHSIRAVAARLGVSRQELYRRKRRGTLRVVATPGESATVPEHEIARLTEERSRARFRKGLIPRVATHRNIDLDSARRWVNRLEKRGFGLDQIAGKAASGYAGRTPPRCGHRP